MIVKTVTVKVFREGNKQSITHRTMAGKYKQFTAEGVEQILQKYADQIDLIAPNQYRMVQVGPGDFNFVHTGQQALGD